MKEGFEMEFYLDYIDPVSRQVGIALLSHVVTNIQKRRNYYIRYGELCELVRNIVGPRQIGENLGVLSEICQDNDLPLISAIVVNDTGMPGNGFFDYFFPECGSKFEKRVAVFTEQYNAIGKHEEDWLEMLEALREYRG